MKPIYQFLLGAIFSLPVLSNAQIQLERHPMALNEDVLMKKESVKIVTEEAKSRLLSSTSMAPVQTDGLSPEGEWNFKMEGLMYDDLTDTDWYGMLVGNLFLLESYQRTSYPIIGEFNFTTNELTISKKYVGRDWRGRYFFIHPYTEQNGKLVAAPITAKFNPETGELKFKDGDYLAWIDYKNYEGTEDPYDEGAWYIVLSAKRTGDLEKEQPDNWDYKGEATIIDGWLSPRFGKEQNLQENWLKAGLYQYKKNPSLYRLKNPFQDLKVENYEIYSGTGYIEFDVSDPDHVVFNRIDSGWTCPGIGINKFYCYNILGYYLTDYKMMGENYSVSDFLLFFNPYIPFTTYKNGIVDLGAILYAGEVVYDANFGDSTYPTGGNIWMGFNMRSRIYFPDIAVTEPLIDFEGEPSISIDIERKCAKIDIAFNYENRPDNATVFVMVFDKNDGNLVARKYVNASKYDKSYSFEIEDLNLYHEYNYAMRIQMEGGLSEILAKSEFKDINFSTDPREVRASGIGRIDGTDSEAVFYNLQGVKIDNPVKGELYIRVTGDKAVKVIF